MTHSTSINNDIENQGKSQVAESGFASKGYPDDAILLLNTLFGEFTNCYVELRMLRKGSGPIQLFCSSVEKIQWDLIERKNSEGYGCYFGVCLRKTQRGDKSSVASISTLWADLDGKNFGGGKPEALARLQKLPPYLYPSIIVDSGHGYHLYWLLREAEIVEAPEEILKLEGYMKDLALTLNGDSTSDLGRVLRLPGLLNQKDLENPCLCHIIHYEPARRFTPLDFDDYQVEIPKRTPQAKPGRPEEIRQRSDKFNNLAIEKLLESCSFIQHCRDNATTLSEPWWWSMVHVLVVFGKPGRQRIHEFSAPHPTYTQKETEQKIKEASKAADKNVGPHTCLFIEQDLGFPCPETCKAKALGVKSAAGLAAKLATQELRSLYFYCDENGNLKLDMEALTGDILNEFKFITLLDTEEVLVYDDGYWQCGGEAKIKAEAEKRVGLSKLLTVHVINEIIGHIQRSTYTARGLLNQFSGIINLKNGLLDVTTRELKPHTPEFLSTIRIPVAYDPDADCPRIKQFLAEVLEPQDIPVIHELAGYALIPDYSLQRAFLFIGDGSNGKSTLLQILRIFLGKNNCSTVAWHALEYSRFASSRLDGKLLNIYADLPSRSMNSTGTFKMLTGGDAISAEKKFKDSYSFVNFARLLFSANKPPQILDEDSYAFWRRWIVINFPSQFPENDPRTDPDLLSKLTTETELSGLLNLALDGLQRLLFNSRFSYGKTVDQTQSYYLKASDPVYAFVEDCCEFDPEAVTSKDELFDAFRCYCQVSKTPVMNRDSFHRTLKNSPHCRVASTRPTVDGERVPSWRGVRIVNPVNPVNPLGMTLRDACEYRHNEVEKVPVR